MEPAPCPAFAEEYGISAAASAEDAVRERTWWSRPRPRLRQSSLGSGSRPGYVNAIGAPRPDWRELDDEVLERARVYVDSREAAEGVGGRHSRRSYLRRGREVVSGAKPGRQSDEEVTLFKSLGLAVEDVATAEVGL